MFASDPCTGYFFPGIEGRDVIFFNTREYMDPIPVQESFLRPLGWFNVLENNSAD